MPDTLLPAIELQTGHRPIASVIWLHGLGADGNDFVSVVRELKLPDSLPLRFIFPHAPMRPVSVNGGHVMRAWYDLSQGPSGMKSNENDIRASQSEIYKLIEREISRGVASDKIILAGFSQGGVITLQAGLRYERKLNGIIALSTYLAMHDSLEKEATEVNKNIPIFMAHGEQDNVIQLSIAEKSREVLQKHGYQPDWHQYPMPHSVCMEEIEAISAWLQKQVG
ncbi:MAG: Carboxylesterase 2 [Pseudomonadota bacterium]|jgi:phospholipase/carboxylesterase